MFSININIIVSDRDECASNPCIHGRCREGIGYYWCECDPNYGDPRCSTGKLLLSVMTGSQNDNLLKGSPVQLKLESFCHLSSSDPVSLCQLKGIPILDVKYQVNHFWLENSENSVFWEYSNHAISDITRPYTAYHIRFFLKIGEDTGHVFGDCSCKSIIFVVGQL